MSKKPEILFVLNGHKYVSYFFEPLAHYSISKGLSVGVALPKTGELDHEKWSEASKVLRFLAVKKIRNPWDIIAEFFQSPSKNNKYPAYCNNSYDFFDFGAAQSQH